MIRQTITIPVPNDEGILVDREFTIHSLSFGAFAMMEDYGFNLNDIWTYLNAPGKAAAVDTAAFALALLATCLTELEPRVNGFKERVWTPGELGDNLQPGSTKALTEALGKIIIDARDTSFPWFEDAVELVKDPASGIEDIFSAKVELDKRKAGGALPPEQTVQPKKSTGPTEQ